MRQPWVCLVASVVAGLLLLGRVGAGGAEEPELLPGNAEWVRRLDFQLDQKLAGDVHSENWRIVVKNNKLSGHPVEGQKQRAELAGEVIAGRDGKPPVVYWRQDNSNIKGYAQVFSGHRVEPGRIVGTWYDTDGQSGDFELALHKK